MRKSIPKDVWVNGIVFFGNGEIEDVSILSNDVWFADINNLVEYISANGNPCFYKNANYFFNKCVALDCLYSKKGDKFLLCSICNDSLNAIFDTKQINRSNIKRIDIKHHWCYDEVQVTLVNNQMFCITKENLKIQVVDKGIKKDFSLCKLDCIEFGSYF